MHEIKGDLFESRKADAICITTNGYVTIDHIRARLGNTMGRGSAGEAKKRWPGIEFMLGALLTEGGNHAHILTDEVPEVCDGAVNPCGPILTLHASPWVAKDYVVPYHIVSFPTKNETAAYFDLLDRYQTPERAMEGANGAVFPGWMGESNLALIEQSARELVALADSHDLPNKMARWESIVLPRMGCGAGELDWEQDVKPIVAPILDDRFHVITYK